MSPFEETLALLGDRWTLSLVDALAGSVLRFQEIQSAVPGIASNILSARLRRLEEGGLLARHTYMERPPRVEYRLTPAGEEAAALVHAARHWGARNLGGPGVVTHAVCGTTAEVVWWCPTCEARIEPDEPLAWV